MRSLLKARAAALAATWMCATGAAFAGGAGGTAHHDSTDADAAFIAAEAWAFPVFPPPPNQHAPRPDLRKLLHVTGSSVSYTQAQVDSLNDADDWFPQDHPPTPQIVKAGRKPASPCAECHLISGAGVPATAILASLPKAYILEQVAAFRAGQRGMGGPATAHDMVEEARALTPVDLQQAADYFSSVPFVRRVQVVESATVPRTHWQFFVQVPDTDGAREPIGERIIETPANLRDYEYRDTRAEYVAYVPPGSIAAGAVISAQGEGSAAACESCHGAKLDGQTLPGIGVVPPLAGRSPTYIARELILFRLGRRSNPGAAPMRAEVSHLTLKDMIDVAAYAASRKP